MLKNNISSPSHRIFNQSFYRSQFLYLFLGAILLWLLFDNTGLDQWIARLYYDFDKSKWPFAKNPTTVLAYNLSKELIIAFGVLLLGLFFYSFKNYHLAPYHRILLFLIICLIIVPSEIGLLKSFFYKARPEQAIEFGGKLPHTGLFKFLWGAKDASNWPGGHVSGGAALLAIYFPLRDRSKTLGYLGLAFALLYWFGMSWIQVMRGQHFMSHNLWTLWFTWLTILLIHRHLFKSRL